MKQLLLLSALALSGAVMAQQFPYEIAPSYEATTVLVSPSPLKTQILFVGGVDMVQTTATYGNPAGEFPAKEWHDFIGITPDNSGQSLGWISVNHEERTMSNTNGDGGGMTVFRLQRDPNTDTLIIMDQTLSDGRSGKFFNVDFVNTVGETGTNCGGIQSSVDGRIWTSEEYGFESNKNLANYIRDTSDVTIQGSGIAMADGKTIKKFENFHYMVEIDPKEAKAIRKQYNWGRQNFEGGVVLPDNKTVFLGVDATPSFWVKFVADVAGDFTKGKLYVWKHDAANPWVEVDNTDMNKMLNFYDEAIAIGATMFDRLEWVAYDPISGKVYITETGRDKPADSWGDEFARGAVLAPHHIARAASQGTTADNLAYWDYFGRVLEFDPATNQMSSFLEGGPYFDASPEMAAYPGKHLSNPDGLNFLTVNGKSYMLIMEDLNGNTFGRTPAGISNRACEMYLLDMEKTPELANLVRIAVVPAGAEITGGVGTPDGKSILFNSQHPSGSNPEPYNHAMTIAVTGWDQMLTSLNEVEQFETALGLYPNPATREVSFSKVSTVAIYNALGQRLSVHNQVKSIDISGLAAGNYFVRDMDGKTVKLIVQ